MIKNLKCIHQAIEISKWTASSSLQNQTFPIIAPKPSFPIKRFAESGTQNAITEAIADNYSGTVNVTAEELFAAAGLPSESNYNDGSA